MKANTNCGPIPLNVFLLKSDIVIRVYYTNKIVLMAYCCQQSIIVRVWRPAAVFETNLEVWTCGQLEAHPKKLRPILALIPELYTYGILTMTANYTFFMIRRLSRDSVTGLLPIPNLVFMSYKRPFHRTTIFRCCYIRAWESCLRQSRRDNEFQLWLCYVSGELYFQKQTRPNCIHVRDESLFIATSHKIFTYSIAAIVPFHQNNILFC